MGKGNNPNKIYRQLKKKKMRRSEDLLFFYFFEFRHVQLSDVHGFPSFTRQLGEMRENFFFIYIFIGFIIYYYESC